MRIIEPNSWRKEKQEYLQELSINSDEYYTQMEQENTKKLFDLTYSMKQDQDLDSVEIQVNPLIKLVSLPFVFEDPEEHALRGSVERKVVLIPSSFIENKMTIYSIKLQKNEKFFMTLKSLNNSFSIRTLLQLIQKQMNVEDISELEIKIRKIIKQFLHQQILIVK